jgi:predicted DNA-binding antitoxin AbrB/MazE fold protein
MTGIGLGLGFDTGTGIGTGTAATRRRRRLSLWRLWGRIGARMRGVLGHGRGLDGDHDDDDILEPRELQLFAYLDGSSTTLSSTSALAPASAEAPAPGTAAGRERGKKRKYVCPSTGEVFRPMRAVDLREGLASVSHVKKQRDLAAAMEKEIQETQEKEEMEKAEAQDRQEKEQAAHQAAKGHWSAFVDKFEQLGKSQVAYLRIV